MSKSAGDGSDRSGAAGGGSSITGGRGTNNQIRLPLPLLLNADVVGVSLIQNSCGLLHLGGITNVNKHDTVQTTKILVEYWYSSIIIIQNQQMFLFLDPILPFPSVLVCVWHATEIEP